MIRNNRGVALATLVIAVVVMLTITGTIAYTSLDTMKLRKLDDMYNDIRLLNQKVTNYYLDNNELPVYESNLIIQSEDNDIVSKISTEKQPINPNDNEIYYIIDLEQLGGITLKYGKNYKDAYDTANNTIKEEMKDVYIINEVSHTIYYVSGIEISEDGMNIKKHRLEENYTEINLPIQTIT